MSAPRRGTHQTRSARARRQMLIKAGVWAFLLLFVFSIAGVALVAVRQ